MQRKVSNEFNRYQNDIKELDKKKEELDKKKEERTKEYLKFLMGLIAELENQQKKKK